MEGEEGEGWGLRAAQEGTEALPLPRPPGTTATAVRGSSAWQCKARGGERERGGACDPWRGRWAMREALCRCCLAAWRPTHSHACGCSHQHHHQHPNLLLLLLHLPMPRIALPPLTHLLCSPTTAAAHHAMTSASCHPHPAGRCLHPRNALCHTGPPCLSLMLSSLHHHHQHQQQWRNRQHQPPSHLHLLLLLLLLLPHTPPLSLLQAPLNCQQPLLSLPPSPLHLPLPLPLSPPAGPSLASPPTRWLCGWTGRRAGEAYLGRAWLRGERAGGGMRGGRE